MAKNVLPSAAAQKTEPEKERGVRGFWSNLAGILLRRREASIIVVAIILVVYFQASNQNFLTQDNIRTLSQFVAATAIIAAGEVMLLICGEIDLSVGMVFAFAPFIMYLYLPGGLTDMGRYHLRPARKWGCGTVQRLSHCAAESAVFHHYAGYPLHVNRDYPHHLQRLSRTRPTSGGFQPGVWKQPVLGDHLGYCYRYCDADCSFLY